MKHLKLASVLLFLAACAGPGINENDPTAVMKAAEDDIQSSRYLSAVEKLKIVKNKFPYSNLATDAQIRIADVYFLQESYGEAAVAYETFRDLHPKHPKTSYALFRSAKSHFKDCPSTTARDLTTAYKAVDAYKEFLGRYPDAPEASEAQKELGESISMLAEKEFSIASFYLKRDLYSSAKPRFEKVTALYPETSFAKESQEKLKEISQKLNDGKR